MIRQIITCDMCGTKMPFVVCYIEDARGRELHFCSKRCIKEWIKTL